MSESPKGLIPVENRRRAAANIGAAVGLQLTARSELTSYCGGDPLSPSLTVVLAFYEDKVTYARKRCYTDSIC